MKINLILYAFNIVTFDFLIPRLLEMSVNQDFDRKRILTWISQKEKSWQNKVKDLHKAVCWHF